MPKFRVIGLERDTGEQAERIVEAADKDAAAAAAGILVEVVKKYTPPPKPLRANTPDPLSPPTPFLDLQVAGQLSSIIGVLLIIIGIISGMAAASEYGPIGLLVGAGGIACGVIIYALGTLCFAVRVIAINSEKK